jgi:hypothetical protein
MHVTNNVGEYVGDRVVGECVVGTGVVGFGVGGGVVGFGVGRGVGKGVGATSHGGVASRLSTNPGAHLHAEAPPDVAGLEESLGPHVLHGMVGVVGDGITVGDGVVDA